MDPSATFELPWYGLTLTPHGGHQDVTNNSNFSYAGWSPALGKGAAVLCVKYTFQAVRLS